jgi:hypothetical protein
VNAGRAGSTCAPDAISLGKGCVIARKETNGKIEIADAEMHLSSVVLVERLVARGFSRLSAERFVEIERGAGEAGRARPHPVARR